jgi:hypothetical protein
MFKNTDYLREKNHQLRVQWQFSITISNGVVVYEWRAALLSTTTMTDCAGVCCGFIIKFYLAHASK